MTERDMKRTVDRMAAKIRASEEDRATLRQELIWAYLQIQALERALQERGQ